MPRARKSLAPVALLAVHRISASPLHADKNPSITAASPSDFFFLPRLVAENRIYANVHDLGIECRQLLAIRVERRHLRRSGRGPVQRMKCHDDVFLAPESAELDFQLPFALNRRQLKIRSRVSHFQRHSRLPPPVNTIRAVPVSSLGLLHSLRSSSG